MLKNIINLYQRHAARKMFSRWSPIYELEVTENHYSASDAVAKKALQYLDGNARAAIVDAGIGTGLTAQQIYDSVPCSITGLDFTEDMMALCSGRNITQSLLKCDVGKDPWPVLDNTQNMVISAGVMEYLTTEMLQHFLNETERVLQQKGLLVFTYLPRLPKEKKLSFWRGHSGTYLTCGYQPAEMERTLLQQKFAVLEHSNPFKGCLFHDGSSYDYRLIVAQKA